MNFKQSAIRAAGLAVLLGSGVVDCHAADKWTEENTAMELGYQVANALDMFTTMDIRNHENIREVGPAGKFLGENPKPLETVVYFAASGALHYTVSRVLPRYYREAFQGASLVIEGSYAAHNMALGLKWHF